MTDQTKTPAAKDDAAVDAFAISMKAKLAVSRAKGRGGWNLPTVSDESLADMLVHHTTKGNAGTFEDVAIFAMMLHQRGANPLTLVTAHNRAKLGPDLMRRVDEALASKAEPHKYVVESHMDDPKPMLD